MTGDVTAAVLLWAWLTRSLLFVRGADSEWEELVVMLFNPALWEELAFSWAAESMLFSLELLCVLLFRDAE